LEEEASCDYDYIEIYVDQEIYGNTKYCGTKAPRTFHTKQQTSVTVVFHSDASEERSGFLLTWILKDRCDTTEFTCWDTTCIPLSKHCDGVRDCSDDSDEIECAMNPSLQSECGKPTVSPQFPWSRIIGGSESQPGAWPWQVALVSSPVGSNSESLFCGGSILNDEWILSAAHCVEGDSSSAFQNILVRVGLHSKSSSEGQSFRVRWVFRHPSYSNDGHIHNDVALIKIEGRISWSSTVRPICLPETGTYIPSGTVCIATGWGSLYQDGSVFPDAMMQVRLPVVSRTQCRVAYGSAAIDSEKMCTGDTIQGGLDTCSGDSGGPLVCLHEERVWIQVGITSYGIGCGDKNYPGVYARVASHTDWINSVLADYNSTASLPPNSAVRTPTNFTLLSTTFINNMKAWM